MSWSTKIWKPIKLKDGRSIETLADARAIMLALPELHQRNPHWQYAAELLPRSLTPFGSRAALDGRLAFSARGSGCLGKTFRFGPVACVANLNLATYARRSVLRLWVQFLIDRLALDRAQLQSQRGDDFEGIVTFASFTCQPRGALTDPYGGKSTI
jgi:hypothetical protein